MGLDNLLNHVSTINKKYENIEAVTGEAFNIFKILRMETREVNTHSAFIAELLNPAGTHGQKDVFLKLFIRVFNIPGFENMGTIATKVKVEDVFTNGRIDIVIKPKNTREIVIENKIYAGDMDEQLVRYKKCYPDCYLMYLTLNGKEPSAASTTDGDSGVVLIKDIDYSTKSYKEDVLKWLMQCRKEATAHPILRETLTQYINLIKHLTNQTMSDQAKEEIVLAILKHPDNIESAENIFNAWIDVKFKIIEMLKSRIVSDGYIRNSLGLLVEVDKRYDRLGPKSSSFWFHRPNWKYCISFYFGIDFDQFVVGISPLIANHPENLILEKSLNDNLSIIGRNTNYPGWTWVTDYDIWSATDWKNMIDVLPSEITKTLETIIKIIDVKGINLEL